MRLSAYLSGCHVSGSAEIEFGADIGHYATTRPSSDSQQSVPYRTQLRRQTEFRCCVDFAQHRKGRLQSRHANGEARRRTASHETLDTGRHSARRRRPEPNRTGRPFSFIRSSSSFNLVDRASVVFEPRAERRDRCGCGQGHIQMHEQGLNFLSSESPASIRFDQSLNRTNL